MNYKTSKLIQMIEHLMYGYNYQVTIGHELLDADNIKSATKCLKHIFPDCDPCQTKKSCAGELFDEVKYGFDYRGDRSAGLELSIESENKLRILQEEYIEIIHSLIDHNAEIIRLLSYKGIPGYPVYWDYRFFIINNNFRSCFMYGSSSD